MSNDEFEPLTLTVKQAAMFLSISVSTIYKFINSGDIKAINVGRRRLITMDSLKGFIESRS